MTADGESGVTDRRSWIRLSWTAAGALVGALTAVGLWLVTDAGAAGTPPVPADRAGVEGSTTDSRAAIPAPPSRIATGEERREAVADPPEGRAADSTFGVIGHGRILTIDGAPVEGARIIFEDDEAYTLQAGTGPGGSWTLDDLRPAEYEVRIAQRGFLPLTERVTVPAARSWKRDFVLEEAISYPVRFEDPAGEALDLDSYSTPTRFLGVVATRERPGRRLSGVGGRVVYRYGEGTFLSRSSGNTPPDLGPRHQGILQLRSAPSLWVSAVFRDVVLESRPVHGGEEELVFVVDPAALDELRGEVRARIIDRDTGAPIVEGVTLSHPSGGLRVKARDESGTLVFDDVLPGTLDLSLDHGPGGWERLEREVDVPPGGIVDLGTIAVGKREEFRVHLRDETGAPLVLSVGAVRPELAGCPDDLNLRVHVESGADGTATVHHLAPGPTLLLVGGRDCRARVARLVDTMREKEVELVVPPGVEVVLKPERDRVPGLTYLLEDASGTFLFGGSYLPRGVFLVSGSYRVRVLDGQKELERVPFTVSGQRVVVRYGGI